MELKPLVVIMIAILVIDIIWLGMYFGNKFSQMLTDVQREETKLKIAPAIAAYILMIIGQYYFVHPHNKDYKSAAINGALFGLVTFGIFDFTNLAILNNYGTSIALQDVAWGTTLNTMVSLITFYATS